MWFFCSPSSGNVRSQAKVLALGVAIAVKSALPAVRVIGVTAPLPAAATVSEVLGLMERGLVERAPAGVHETADRVGRRFDGDRNPRLPGRLHEVVEQLVELVGQLAEQGFARGAGEHVGMELVALCDTWEERLDALGHEAGDRLLYVKKVTPPVEQ